MSQSSQSERLYRRLIEEAFNENNFDIIDELVDDDVVFHDAGQSDPVRGQAQLKEFFEMYRKAFPDAHIEIEELLSEDDLVVARWTGTGTHEGALMGVEPTGADVEVMGMEMFRVSNGKLVEGWQVFDRLGMLQQLGALPAEVDTAVSAADD